MAFEFKKLAALMGLAAADTEVTQAHLKAADDKIALLEASQAAAELRATNAETALTAMTTRATTAEADVKTAQAEAKTATEKVATLEKWKRENQAEDEREDDELNDTDAEKAGPKASFESVAAGHIARVQKTHGGK